MYLHLENLTLKDLKNLEKKYFDTYKMKRTPKEKYTHLEEMALIIRKIEQKEKNGKILHKTKKSKKKA